MSRSYGGSQMLSVRPSLPPPPPRSASAKPYIASMGIYVMKAAALKEMLEVHMPDANDFGNEVGRGRSWGRGAGEAVRRGAVPPELGAALPLASRRQPSAPLDPPAPPCSLPAPRNPTPFQQIIPGARKMGFKVQAHAFQGYWEDIGTIEAFYNANLALANPEKNDFRWAAGEGARAARWPRRPRGGGGCSESGPPLRLRQASLARGPPPAASHPAPPPRAGPPRSRATHPRPPLLRRPSSFYDKDAPIYTMSRFLPPSKVVDAEVSCRWLRARQGCLHTSQHEPPGEGGQRGWHPYLHERQPRTLGSRRPPRGPISGVPSPLQRLPPRAPPQPRDTPASAPRPPAPPVARSTTPSSATAAWCARARSSATASSACARWCRRAR
jgi:hypothetical protein